MRRVRALWLVALTAALVLLLAILFALRQQDRRGGGTQLERADAMPGTLERPSERP